jgi:hypothetical protein
MMTKLELLVEVLDEGLANAKVGLIVKGISELTPVAVMDSLSKKIGKKLFSVAVGYNCSDQDNKNYKLTEKVEDAVKWRSDQDFAKRIIVFIKNESDKLHSLKEFDVVTARSVSEQLIMTCINEETNTPTRKFWEALRNSLDSFSFDALYEFAQSVESEVDSDGNHNTDAISNNMWRLGLLSDTTILGASIKPKEQLAQNRELIVRIGQMSDADRKRLSSALSKAKTEDRGRYQSAYRSLQTLFKYGKRETLKELDFVTVRELLSAIKAAKKTSPSMPDDDNGRDSGASEKTIREKELGEIIARCVVISFDENKDYLSELLDRVKTHFESEDHPTDIGQLSGDEFDNRKIVLDKHESALLTKIRQFCSTDDWGGIMETEESVLRDAVESRDIVSTDRFKPEQEDSVISYCGRTLFELLRSFDEEFKRQNLDSIDYFSDTLEDLLANRRVLSQNLELIMYFPVLAFSMDDSLTTALNLYSEKWAELLRAFNRNEFIMREIDHEATRVIARSLLYLDTLYIKTPSEWKGILLPLHPLFLWRYYEVFKSIDDHAQFSEQDAINLSKVFTELPQVLNFLVVGSLVTTDNTVELPCSGSYEMLPTFENKSNRYLGDDGIGCVEEVLSRWIAFAPYTNKEIRICTVDAPNNAKILKSLKEFLQKNYDCRLVYSIFLTRGQNGNADMSKLEYDTDDYEIAEFIRRGRLSIAIKNFPERTALQDIKSELTERPVHLAYYFDQSSYKIEHGPSTQQLYINPLVVTYDYQYHTITKRGEVFPSTDTESGIIGDYHKLMRVADLTTLNSTPRPTFNPAADIEALLTTVRDRQTVWLIGADRTINNYLPKATIPIGEKRYKQRTVGIWTSDNSRIVEQYMMLLREYNLYPHRETFLKILANFGHISSDGLISIPRSGSNATAIDNRRKGLIGTVFAAKFYSKKFPNSLIASLDTHDARLWLSDNKLVEGNERADLIGLRYIEKSNTLYVEPIEVKTRDESPDARIGISESGERIVEGHAADQIASVILMIRQMFSGEQNNMFTVARKEILKFQIVSECFRDLHDHDWQQEWDKLFRKLFGKTPTSDLNIIVRGKLVHVKLGEPIQQPTVTCKHGTHLDCEIDVITLTTKDIQEHIFESEVPSGGVDWGNPDFDHTTEPDDGAGLHEPDSSSNFPIDMSDDVFEEEHTIDAADTSTAAEIDVEFADNAVLDETTGIANSTESVRASSDTPGSSNEITDAQKLTLANDFKRSCHGYGIRIEECNPNNAVVGSSLIRFPFKLSSGQRMAPLMSSLEDIGREMGSTGILVQTATNGDTYLDVPRVNRDKVLFSDVISKIPTPTSPEQLYFPIGRTPDGEDIFQDLKDCPHLLVGGSTGAGKSVFLYTLLCAILKTHPKSDDCKILLASSKREDFVYFDGLPQLVEGRVISDAAEIMKMFREYILNQTKSRSALLIAARKNNIIKYNETAFEKLSPLVVIIDEFADLTDQLTTTRDKNNFYAIFKEIAQAGRSKGIHLVLCTQRPSADVVPANITTNLNARLALRVNNANASRMIINDKGAENLLKHGDMLYCPDTGTERIRAQGYFIDVSEIEEIVANIKS